MTANAMTVDVEDWFQVGAFEGVIDRADWSRLPSRVEANVDRLLGLFDEAGVKATFFTLSWVAERHPHLIMTIAKAGHEIASHGCCHDRVYHFQPGEFAHDVARSKAVLEQATGQRVSGYRAPSFSLTAKTPWAHGILAEQGYDYSSSIMPIQHDHYGWPDAPRFAWRPLPGHPFMEIPISTSSFLGRSIPSGGGFFRLFPYALSRSVVRAAQAAGQEAIFYIHPWDIDGAQPFLKRAPLASQLRHYVGLRTTYPKLARLVSEFTWTRLDGIVASKANAPS